MDRWEIHTVRQRQRDYKAEAKKAEETYRETEETTPKSRDRGRQSGRNSGKDRGDAKSGDDEDVRVRVGDRDIQRGREEQKKSTGNRKMG
jgi:predicted transposase YdaD